MSIHYSKARKRYFICYKAPKKDCSGYTTVSIYNSAWTKELGKKYVKSIEEQAVEEDMKKRRLRVKRGNFMTVRELVDQVEEEWRLEFKLWTAYQKEHIAEKYVIGWLGASKPVSQVLNPAAMKGLRDEIAKLPYVPKWKNRLLSIIRSIVRFSADRDVISSDLERKLLLYLKPISDAGQRKEKLSYWTDGEWERFISSFDSEDRFKMLFEVTYVCGLRFGEVMALTWSDFSPKSKTISINKSMDVRGNISTTKTASSNATVSLPSSLVAKLEEYKKGFAASEGDLMFFADGRTSRTTVRRVMVDHIRKSGVPPIRFHGLRHSCATHLIHMGLSPLIVSKHLRHTSVKETLDTYSHVFPNETAEAIDRFFK